MKMVCKSIHSGSVVLVSLCAVLVTGTGKGGIAIPSFLGARKAHSGPEGSKIFRSSSVSRRDNRDK